MEEKAKFLECRKSFVGLVITTGYAFNLDGLRFALLWLLFIAQVTNAPMTITQQFTLFLALLLASKGAAGIACGGFITLAATLSAVGNVPVARLAIILGINRFMSEVRALTNLIANRVVTLLLYAGLVNYAKNSLPAH